MEGDEKLMNRGAKLKRRDEGVGKTRTNMERKKEQREDIRMQARKKERMKE